MNRKISPSMMCADISKILPTLKIFEEQGIEMLHIDVMDGNFVPNFTLGTDYIKNIRSLTRIPLDIHLMVVNPEDKLDFFTFCEGDRVSIHAESTCHLQKVLAKIREKGAKPFVAINPATPLCIIENVLDDIDGVLIMSVNPGFAGQKLVPVTLKKTRELRTWLDNAGYKSIEIEIDGNVSFENAALIAEAGADIFVVGTSSIFSSPTGLTEGIKRFRAIINGDEYVDEDILLEFKQCKTAVCSCGKFHSCMSKLYISSGEINRIAERVKDYAAKKVYLVADKNTFTVAGERINELLCFTKIDVVNYVFNQDHLIPDEKNVGLAVMNLPHDSDIVMGVGSGVINDICKIIASTAKLPYIIVATAPSMDGYASATSSMEMNGLKISLPSKAADTIIGDLDTLAAAPAKMLSSGIGDMLAKYVSICEWRIANIITGEYYCEEVATLMRTALARCIEVFDRLLTGDKEAVRAVFEGLVLSGVATEYAGVSRPASGVEHYISHIFDMRGVSFGTMVDMHGIQCGIATIIAVRLYEKLCSYAPDFTRAENYIKTFDYTAHSNDLKDFIGLGAKRMIELEKIEKKYDITSHPDRFAVISRNWDKILDIIEEELPSSGKLEDILKKINIPDNFSDIGIDNSLVPNAFNFSKDIRDKYILSRLVWDLGISYEELFEENM